MPIFAETTQEKIIEMAQQQIEKKIELMDESTDSSVSFAEYMSYHNRQAASYDIDINQLLSLEEYKQWVYGSLIESASQNPQIRQQLESEKLEVEKSIEASFTKFDVNGNKSLNKEELIAIHEKNMKNADINEDMLLNKDDIQALKSLMDIQ